MLKVQNGWESHTLEQIAGLTSQQGSPRASVTAASPVSNRQPLHSSNSAMTSNLQRDRNADVSLDGVSAAGGATFDILDRAQRETNHHQRIGSGSHRRALAPPADIVPNSQRQHPHHANPLLNGYRSVNSVRPTASKQRTPSQNAAMEADAVETLLFMASPGNSGHHPSSGRPSSSAQISAPTSSSQPSPLTSEFPNRELLPTSSPHRRVVSSTAANRPETIELPSSRMHDDIDRMIDDMDDDSSPDTDVRFWI